MKLRRSGVTKFLAKSADFRSYQDACALVDWLNQAPAEGNRKRAIRLIEILRAANDVPAVKDVPNDADGNFKRALIETLRFERVGSHLHEIRQLIAPLQKIHWGITLGSTPRCSFWYLEQKLAWDRQVGLLRVARLSSHGLDWVRRCQGPRCEKWFVAQKANNFFCSDACRENAWSERRKTPEGRADRAKYMRDHRATLKKLPHQRKQRGKKNS